MRTFTIRKVGAFAVAVVTLSGCAPGGAAPETRHAVQAIEVDARLLVGTWTLDAVHEGERDVTPAGEQYWTFDESGRFARVTVDREGVREEHGEWRLSDATLEIALSTGGESHEVRTLSERELGLRTPAVVRDGVVIQAERFASFYHS